MTDQVKINKRNYYEKNRELILEKHKIWRDANKDKIKQYTQDNKEYLVQYRKQYYQQNKDRLNKYHQDRNERLSMIQIECVCGSVISKPSLKPHLKSMHHRKFVGE